MIIGRQPRQWSPARWCTTVDDDVRERVLLTQASSDLIRDHARVPHQQRGQA